MGTASLIDDAGLRDNEVRIDGTALEMARLVQVSNAPIFSLFQAMNGRNRVTVPYRGAGLPDQPDSFDFMLDWELGMTTAGEKAAIKFLEQLRTSGGIHEFAYWKHYRYTYSGLAGQQVFYLPRPDAFSKGYKADQTRYGAKFTVLGVATAEADIAYQASVVAADAVPAGKVWISNTAVYHPDSGALCAIFKLGTALATAGAVIVDFIPLFNVFATQVPTKPFERVGREDKSLFLTEVDA